MKNVVLIAVNFLRVTFKKKSSIFVYIILPIIVTLGIVMLYSGAGSRETLIGLSNKDNEILSYDMIEYLEATGKFTFVEIKEAEINEKVAKGDVDLVLTIPKGFTDSVYNNEIKELRITSIKGMDVTAWIESYINLYVENLQYIAKASSRDKEVFEKIYTNLKSSELSLVKEKLEDEYVGKAVSQQGIGFFILFVLLGTTSVTQLVLKEKNEKTYNRICYSPVTSKEYVLGNVLANLIILVIQISLLVFVAFKLLNINIHMSSWILFMILMLFGLAAIGIGMVIISFSKSTAEAGNLSTLIITPTCMLGGCFWPNNIMPDTLTKIANFTPQKWVMDTIISIQSGNTIKEVSINIIIIILFALVFFSIAAFKMKSSDKTGSFI
ncbi:ABC transporter permease [Clostridium grantii]|uniref:Transport permease protein n=1 Tax=Clostridium grantii DSM 8605 TaxID=1121316 RepID=A0A1M5WC12_9CLOT|nr:ABC transporter permease [Clostridium grantii]SHH84987.1 ABC-2 type transport system permease protein [Clostridium grantii DSM 8605]